MLDQPIIDQGVFAGLRPRHYRAIVADPPWNFRCYTDPTKSNLISRRDPEKHYRVMGLGDIKALPVGDLAHHDAHLFMWSTGPFIPAALDMIDAWDFAYSGVAFTWIKMKRALEPGTPVTEHHLHVGLGYTTRKNAEFCFLARPSASTAASQMRCTGGSSSTAKGRTLIYSRARAVRIGQAGEQRRTNFNHERQRKTDD